MSQTQHTSSQPQPTLHRNDTSQQHTRTHPFTGTAGQQARSQKLQNAGAALTKQKAAAIAWNPPPFNQLKLNVDAAVDVKKMKLGVGAVVRNHRGEVLASLSKPVQGCFRSDEMEAKAIFHSLIWTIQHHMPIAIVETDALRVSNALASSSRDISCFSDLIDDIRCLLSSFPGVTIVHTRRQANQAAHGLAKYALELDEDVSWMGEIPYPIFSIIVNDF